MIQNKTARRIMYDWHNGQWSTFYAAASSGLVESFDSLIEEAKSNIPHDSYGDMPKLIQWLEHKKAEAKHQVFICNSYYFILPWVSRTYHQKG